MGFKKKYMQSVEKFFLKVFCPGILGHFELRKLYIEKLTQKIAEVVSIISIIFPKF